MDYSYTPRVVTVGHVDHGKSSFIGRLMYELGQVTEEKFQELKSVSAKRGVEFEFAFLLDALQDERNQGITIDTTQIFFKTERRNYIFIDAPGHKEFIKNMITGASSADIAFLIVDVAEGVKEQTKKHAYLLKILGFERVIVLYNKIDKIKYCQEKFTKINKELTAYLSKLEVEVHSSIPISAKNGDNISKNSEKTDWYLGGTVIDVLDGFSIKNNDHKNELRFPVQDIYKVGDKRIIVGRVESGKITNEDTLLFLPTNQIVKVKSLESWPKSKKEYNQGECVGITLDEQIFVDVGNIASRPGTSPKLMNRFEANVFWLSQSKLKLNKKYDLKINTGQYHVNINEIKKIIDTNNLQPKKNFNVTKNDICELVFHSSQLIPMDDYSHIKSTGRFCLLDENEIVAGGILNLKNFPDQKEVLSETKKNILPEEFYVSEIDRSVMLKHRPGIIWLTGLSGSGKSTIAKGVEKKLFSEHFNVFSLDGDNIRLGLNKDLSFSPEDRTENIRRTAEVAKLFSEAGFIVIVSLISPYRSERRKARDIRPEIFKLIYTKASLDICTKRDVKGLYAKAKSGEIKSFTGISSPYEEPEKPELIIDTEKENVNESIEKLYNFIKKEFSFS